ncbi:MAG: ATP synthase F0 subunit B [Bacilli bacterium]
MSELFLSLQTFSDKAGTYVSDGVALINKALQNTLGITLIEMAMQLCATFVIYLMVKYLLWNKIEPILQKRKDMVKDAVSERDKALDESDEIRKNANEALKMSRIQADSIVENAKKKGYTEAEKIVNKANMKAELRIKNAAEEANRMKAESEKEIKNEIIDVAYTMASKIVDKEVKKNKYDIDVDQLRKGKKHE